MSTQAIDTKNLSNGAYCSATGNSWYHN